MLKKLKGYATEGAAMAQARNYSLRYCTFWYVRKESDGSYSPYAHHSDDARTVACFYCGKPFTF